MKLRHLIINHINSEDETIIKACVDRFLTHKKIEAVHSLAVEKAPNNIHIHSIIEHNGAYNQTVRDQINKYFIKELKTDKINYECTEFKDVEQLDYTIRIKKEQPKNVILTPMPEIHEIIRKLYPHKVKDDFEAYKLYMETKNILTTDTIAIGSETMRYLINKSIDDDKKTPFHIIKNKAVYYACRFSDEFKEEYTQHKIHQFLTDCGLKSNLFSHLNI